MGLKRNEIKHFMDIKYKNTTYYMNFSGVKNEFLLMETMALEKLDFIPILRNLYFEIQSNYKSLKSNKWAPSQRQEYLIKQLNLLLNTISSKNIETDKHYIQNYYDFYWCVWDYFDDYNNKNDEVSKEEIDAINPILECFFNI